MVTEKRHKRLNCTYLNRSRSHTKYRCFYAVAEWRRNRILIDGQYIVVQQGPRNVCAYSCTGQGTITGLSRGLGYSEDTIGSLEVQNIYAIIFLARRRAECQLVLLLLLLLPCPNMALGRGVRAIACITTCISFSRLNDVYFNCIHTSVCLFIGYLYTGQMGTRIGHNRSSTTCIKAKWPVDGHETRVSMRRDIIIIELVIGH